jgi:WD40 repeat protein/V8-like Glu-specific endopeptidase
MLPAALHEQLVSALLEVPGIHRFDERTALLSNVPPHVVQGLKREEFAHTDLTLLVQQLDGFEGLTPTGERWLIVVARDAHGAGGGASLAAVVTALADHYGSGAPGAASVVSSPLSSTVETTLPEAIIFDDERVPQQFIERARAAGASVARLRVPRLRASGGADAPALGTGWVIAPGLVLTNHHVIAATGPGEAPATMDECRAQAAGTHAWFDYWVEGGDRDERAVAELVHMNAALDYALLRLADGARRSPLPVAKAPRLLVTSERLNIVQYPRGGPMKYAIRDNEYMGTAGPGAPHLLRYLTDTEGGSSGSPVLDDTWSVVALHHAAISVPPQQHRGQSTKLNNEGIAIHAILKDLPKALQDEIAAAQGWNGDADGPRTTAPESTRPGGVSGATEGSPSPPSRPPRSRRDPIGRGSEMEALRKLADAGETRLLGIFGMGGLGMGTLARALERSAEGFERRVIRQRLGDAAHFQAVLEGLIEELGGAAANGTDLVPRFVERLDAERCLVVLCDLPPGRALLDDPLFGALLGAVAGGENKSLVVLTGPDAPDVFRSSSSAEAVRDFGALRPFGAAETRALFSLVGHGHPFTGDEAHYAAIAEYYGGVPYFLKTIARQILLPPCPGDLADHLAHLAGSDTPSEIAERLEQQLERLHTEAELSVLYWLAVHREPASRETLKKDEMRAEVRSDFDAAIGNLSGLVTFDRGTRELRLAGVFLKHLTLRLVREVAEEVLDPTRPPRRIDTHALALTTAIEEARKAQHDQLIGGVITWLRSKRLGDEAIRKLLNAKLDLVRNAGPHDGYTAGNVINLLGVLRGGATGANLSGLVVRHADLRETLAQRVDLTGARLLHPAFLQAFCVPLAVASSGDTYALADSRGAIVLYKLDGSGGRRRLMRHTHWVWALAFSQNGQRLASASEDCTVRVWDLNGRELAVIRNAGKQRMWAVALSADGRRVVTGDESGEVCVYALEDGRAEPRREASFQHGAHVWGVALHPGGERVASAGDDKHAKVWKIGAEDPIVKLAAHDDRVRSVAFHPTRPLLATGSNDGKVRVFSTDTGALEGGPLEQGGWVRTVAFDREGKRLVAGAGSGAVRLYDTERWSTPLWERAHADRVWSVGFSSDGGTVLSASQDRRVRLWDTTTGRCLKKLRGHDPMIWGLAWSPDGRTLASAGSDRRILLWDVAQRTPRVLDGTDGHRGAVLCVAFSKAGDLLASGGDDNTVRVWNVSGGRPIGDPRKHENWVWSVVFDPAGRVASCSNDRSVRLWDAEGDGFNEIGTHASWARCLALSADGTRAASGDERGVVRIWDVATGATVAETCMLKPVWALAFWPEGPDLLIGANDGTVSLWDPLQDPEGKLISKESLHKDWVPSVAVADDGTTLASAGHDGFIRILRAKGRKMELVRTLGGHAGPVSTVAFRPGRDDLVLASAGEDGVIILHDVATGKRLDTLATERPYEGMILTDVEGLEAAEIQNLVSLGARPGP